MRPAILRFLLPLCLILLAACGADMTTTPPESTSDAPVLQETVIPVIESDAFLEPVDVITSDNANRLQSLGILTPPAGANSTLFAHAFSIDGTRLLALNQESLTAWNLITGQLLFGISRQGASQVYTSSDKSEIYTLIPETGEIVIYNEAGDVQTRLTIHPDYNRAIDFDAENDWLATGGTDGTVKVWSLPQRNSEVTIEAHNSPILQVAFSSDGTYLATADESSVIRIWDWATREQQGEYSSTNPVIGMTFSPDDTQLAVATEFDVNLWDVTTDTLFRTLTIQGGGANEIFTYSPDGAFFITAGGAADMAVWNPVTGNIVAQIPDVSDNRLSVAFSPESDLMITTTLDRNISLWNLREVNLETQQIARATLNLETRRIVRGAWSPDGYTLAFFDTDGRVYIRGIAEEVATE